jgi:hypothetical protein
LTEISRESEKTEKGGSILKIKGTSSYITVEIDDKTVKIQGEMLAGGFLAYADTIKHWEAPYEDVIIDENTKAKIIKDVMDETGNSDYEIQFDKKFAGKKLSKLKEDTKSKRQPGK